MLHSSGTRSSRVNNKGLIDLRSVAHPKGNSILPLDHVYFGLIKRGFSVPVSSDSWGRQDKGSPVEIAGDFLQDCIHQGLQKLIPVCSCPQVGSQGLLETVQLLLAPALKSSPTVSNQGLCFGYRSSSTTCIEFGLGLPVVG